MQTGVAAVRMEDGNYILEGRHASSTRNSKKDSRGIIQLTMAPTMTVQLQDIQQRRDGTNLSELIVQGLLSIPLKLPSLLLWDDDGLDLFDALTQTPTYYLHDKEVEILAQYANDMAARIPSGSVLIELGCG